MNPRIIKGFLKDKKLIVPKKARPITDRLKVMLFDCFDESFWQGLVVIDLYAGSGSLGLEALSRGAKTLYLVDNDNEALNALKKFKNRYNLDKVFIESCSTQFYIKKFKDLFTKTDIVFLDPPFENYSEGNYIMSTVAKYMRKNSIIIYKRDATSELLVNEKKLELVKGLKTKRSIVDIFVIC